MTCNKIEMKGKVGKISAFLFFLFIEFGFDELLLGVIEEKNFQV